mgnify:CR=1 FL=1
MGHRKATTISSSSTRDKRARAGESIRKSQAGRTEPHLFLQVFPLEGKHAGKDTQHDKVVIVDQFARGERRQSVEQEFGALFKVADREEVDAAVDFEAVAAVPVSALVDEPVTRRRGESSC